MGTEYVIGVAFDALRGGGVLLLRKRSDRGPEAVRGLWNAPGGKIEHGETPEQAVAREFREETQIATTPQDWQRVCTLRFDSSGATVHVLTAFLPRLGRHAGTAEEPTAVFHWRALPPDSVFNLSWIVPLCADFDRLRGDLHLSMSNDSTTGEVSDG